jgi:PAS domain-containing protein
MGDLNAAEPEEIISFVLSAVREAQADKLAALDALATPVYATDSDGVITYYNRACVDFSGRQPVTGVDRWCVTWKLYTTEGAELPHDRCPMAVAIQEARPVRGAEAIAKRPDGSQVHFIPYPTPIHDRSGAVVGAVNLLVDVAEARHVRHLRSQAERCRRLARNIDDRTTRERLNSMAASYEERAKGQFAV